MSRGAVTSGPWHHGSAALTTFLATPVFGLAQVFLAESLASGGHPAALIYQATVWLMMMSFLVSWLLLPLLLPFTTLAAQHFGAAFWLAMPVGAGLGGLIAVMISGRIEINDLTLPSALTGAVMAAIYCAALRWFAAR